MVLACDKQDETKLPDEIVKFNLRKLELKLSAIEVNNLASITADDAMTVIIQSITERKFKQIQ